MSELKVLVDGKEREIRGVSEETTCEDIILVLAKAAGKTGKVALLEKWHGYERILPPDESPLKCMQSWGFYKHDVALILQDESLLTNNHLDNTSLNLRIGDNSDRIKRPLDCESQEAEDVVNFQQRKLERLARAIEMVNLQSSCYKDNEEAFLYLTEDEIAQELCFELEEVIRLTAKELVESKTWESELESLEQIYENLSKQRDAFEDKISKVDERIAEAYDAVDMLMEEVEEEGKKFKEARISEDDNALVREKLEVVSRELSEQNALFCRQDLELNSVRSSLLDLSSSVKSKNDCITQLKIEMESCSDDTFTSGHFHPQVPEAKSTERYGNSNSIGLYGGQTKALKSIKINDKSHQTQPLCAEIEMLADILQNEEELGKNPPKKETRSNSEEHESEKLERFPSPPPSFFENGIDEFDHFPISNPTEIKHMQNLENSEESSKFTLTASTESRQFSPEVKSKSTEVSSPKPSKSNPTPTKNHSSKSSDISKFHSKRKESFKKIREVFEQRNFHESVVNDSVTDQDCPKFSTRPHIAPKPSKSKICCPHLENSVSPLEEKLNTSDSDGHLYSPWTETRQNSVVFPRPYRNASAKIDTIPVVHNSSNMGNDSVNIVNAKASLPSNEKSSNLGMNYSSVTTNHSSSRLGLSSKVAEKKIQDVQNDERSALILKQENSQYNSCSLQTETNNNTDYYKIDRKMNKKITKLTAKPYGMNITNSREPKRFDKQMQSTEFSVHDADSELARTQGNSQQSSLTPTSAFTTQNNTNFRSYSYVTHSTSQSLLSQPLSPPGKNSRAYMLPPTVSNNTILSKKENAIIDTDTADQGIFV